MVPVTTGSTHGSVCLRSAVARKVTSAAGGTGRSAVTVGRILMAALVHSGVPRAMIAAWTWWPGMAGRKSAATELARTPRRRADACIVGRGMETSGMSELGVLGGLKDRYGCRVGLRERRRSSLYRQSSRRLGD